LKSTPFHLRFGKFKALRGNDANIEILINDVKTGIMMKLGSAGEGYFE
jgi:phosphatidate phosphatase LPIN